MAHPNVEFWRPMYGRQSRHGITVGGDVIAWKIALDRSGFFDHKYYLNYDNEYNSAVVAGTKDFQLHHGIDPASGNTGQLTFERMLATHKKGSTEWAFSPTAIRIYDTAREAGQKPTESDVANFIVSALWDMYQYRDSINYSQERPTYPMVHRITDPRKAYKLDCSGEINYSQVLAYWYFRAKGVSIPAVDPLYGYTGYGNTWSIVKGGMRVQERDAQIGDCAWYHNYGHMARIVRLNPISVVSMGSQAGPLYLPLHYSAVNEIRTYPLIRS